MTKRDPELPIPPEALYPTRHVFLTGFAIDFVLVVTPVVEAQLADARLTREYIVVVIVSVGKTAVTTMLSYVRSYLLWRYKR